MKKLEIFRTQAFIFAVSWFCGSLAMAQEQATSPLTSVARIRGCSSTEEAVIRNTDLLMQSRIDTVAEQLPKYDLKYVYDNFVLPKNREWVENGPRNRNYQTYHTKMKNVFQAMQNVSHYGINYECRRNSDRYCENGEVIAYVLFIGNSPIQNLNLCEGFFRNPSGSLETLIHELSHYAASTDDLALSWLDYKNPNLLLAAEDAYHIQEFADGDIDRTLQRQIWFWNWLPKPKMQ